MEAWLVCEAAGVELGDVVTGASGSFALAGADGGAPAVVDWANIGGVEGYALTLG